MYKEIFKKEEVKTINYLKDESFKNRILDILTTKAYPSRFLSEQQNMDFFERYKIRLIEYFLNRKTSVEVGNITYTSDKVAQNTIMGLSFAINNLYENNDYKKHSDLALKLYFYMALREMSFKENDFFDINSIDFVLNLMPKKAIEYLNNKFFLEEYAYKVRIQTRLDNSNGSWAYKIFSFHVKKYNQNHEFFDLLIDKNLFFMGLKNLNRKEREKMISKYIDYYPFWVLYSDSPNNKTEEKMVENVRNELGGNLVQTLRLTCKAQSDK